MTKVITYLILIFLRLCEVEKSLNLEELSKIYIELNIIYIST